MIIGRDVIVELVLSENFRNKVRAWDNAILLMKDPGKFLEKNLT